MLMTAEAYCETERVVGRKTRRKRGDDHRETDSPDCPLPSQPIKQTAAMFGNETDEALPPSAPNCRPYNGSVYPF